MPNTKTTTRDGKRLDRLVDAVAAKSAAAKQATADRLVAAEALDRATSVETTADTQLRLARKALVDFIEGQS